MNTPEQLQASAGEAAALLKAMSHPSRLLILCMLCDAPGTSAGELARTWRAFDVPVADPDAHSSLLWLGDARTARWTRASALAPTERLLELMRQVAT